MRRGSGIYIQVFQCVRLADELPDLQREARVVDGQRALDGAHVVERREARALQVANTQLAQQLVREVRARDARLRRAARATSVAVVKACASRATYNKKSENEKTIGKLNE